MDTLDTGMLMVFLHRGLIRKEQPKAQKTDERQVASLLAG